MSGQTSNFWSEVSCLLLLVLLFYKVSIIRKMIELQPKGLRRIKTHKKEYSNYTNASFQKRRFLEVISAECTQKRSTPAIKTIVQLKSKDAGHRTTRSVSQNLTVPVLQRDFNRGSASNLMERTKHGGLRNVPNLLRLSEWATDLQVSKYQAVATMREPGVRGSRGNETPIKKLLFESSCKQNLF